MNETYQSSAKNEIHRYSITFIDHIQIGLFENEVTGEGSKSSPFENLG